MSHAVPFHRAAAGFPYRSDKSRAAWVRISWLLGGWTIGASRALNGSTTCTVSAAEPAGRVLWAGMSIVLSTQFFVESVETAGNWLFAVIMTTRELSDWSRGA